MIEKEERILIKKQINDHTPYGGWRGDGKEIVLTRQKAIKKIEKHLIASTIKFNTTADVVAEIALNGLLEDK